MAAHFSLALNGIPLSGCAADHLLTTSGCEDRTKATAGEEERLSQGKGFAGLCFFLRRRGAGTRLSVGGREPEKGRRPTGQGLGGGGRVLCPKHWEEKLDLLLGERAASSMVGESRGRMAEVGVTLRSPHLSV